MSNFWAQLEIGKDLESPFFAFYRHKESLKQFFFQEITGESQYSMYSLSKYTKTANKNEFAGADKYKDD